MESLAGQGQKKSWKKRAESFAKNKKLPNFAAPLTWEQGGRDPRHILRNKYRPRFYKEGRLFFAIEIKFIENIEKVERKRKNCY